MATNIYAAPHAVSLAAEFFTIEMVDKARESVLDDGTPMFPDVNFEVSGDIIARKRHEDREWARTKEWAAEVGLLS